MLGLESSPEPTTLDQHFKALKRVSHYELLGLRNTVEASLDSEAKNYFTAKELYDKGLALCRDIPTETKYDTLDLYEDLIRKASETLVDAWLTDDRATHLSERILVLGQQYELLLLKSVPEEQKESYYSKYTLLFSSWILLAGHHFEQW
jgi:hypothetical protein